jgi:hypothetical protein
MRALVRKFIDHSAVLLLAHLVRTTRDVTLSVEYETRRRAIADSADYADTHMTHALPLADRPTFWRHAFAQRGGGLIVEFGVWRGHSVNFLASLTNEAVYGFDSFEGLREDWAGDGCLKGDFGVSGRPPRVRRNVRLIKGWFDDTLPIFLREHQGPFSFVHVDCDTYEATRTVLDLAVDRIIAGTILVFDDYFGYRGWRLGGFKAWQEFVAERAVKYRYLAFGEHWVSVRVNEPLGLSCQHASA